MIDPQSAIESLRRSQYRVEVLDWLIALAGAHDAAAREQLDGRIWNVLAAKGATFSDKEVATRLEFCRDGHAFAEYSRLVEAKLSSITA
jgi:hypothetical protein